MEKLVFVYNYVEGGGRGFVVIVFGLLRGRMEVFFFPHSGFLAKVTVGMRDFVHNRASQPAHIGSQIRLCENFIFW
jgi:hypothetical protein